MSLADLIARLEQDADTKVEAITRQADADVLAIQSSAAQAAAESTTRHLAQRRAERHAAYARELAHARRLARMRELEAQHALLSRILDRARVQMPKAAALPQYVAVLPRHLEEALSYLEGLAAQVRCGPSAAAVLRPAVSAHPSIDLVVDEAIGPGLVAEAADGSVLVDNTLAARLARLETRLAVELLTEVGRARG